MKKLNNLLKKTSILTVSTLILIGTTLSTTSLSSVNALYNNNKLVGHGFDALSTKNGLNKPDKGTVSLPFVSGMSPKFENWKGSFSFSDQNGDPDDASTLTLYPGETFHVRFNIKYTGNSIYNKTQPVKYLGNEEFISFRPDFFTYMSPAKVTASNPATNPTLKTTTLNDTDGYTRTILSFSATQIQLGDEFTIEFDLQTVLDLKEKILKDLGEFPSYYNMTASLRALSAGTESYARSLGWVPTEATSTSTKKHLGGNTTQLELTNTTKGSLFNQTIHNSMEKIKVTDIKQIHTAKNPVIDYVDLTMNKGTQITTNGTASQAQIDAVNEQLQAGNFLIDEVQEGDKVVVTYEIIG